MVLIFDIDRNLLTNQWCVPAYKFQAIAPQINTNTATRCIGDIAEIRSGSYVNRYIDKGLLYIRVDNICEFQVNINDEDIEYVSPTVARNSRIVAEENDVLIARTGTLGKAALVSQSLAGSVLSQHVTRLTCDSYDVSGYVACCLNSPAGQSQLIAKGSGSTRLELTHDSLREIQLPWLNVDIKNRINQLVKEGISISDSSNRIIRECIADLENLLCIDIKQEVKDKLLVFETPSLGGNQIWIPQYYKPEMRDSLERLQQDFECLNLGSLASIVRGKGTRVADYKRAGIPFIRTSDLINFNINPFPDHYASEDTYRKFRQPLQEGDILYSIEGKTGISAYVLKDQRCVFKNHVEQIRPHGVDPVYLFLFLNTSIGKTLAKLNTIVQTTLPGMAHRLREFIIPLRKKDSPQFLNLVEKICQKAKAAFNDLAEAVKKWSWAKGCFAEQLV